MGQPESKSKPPENSSTSTSKESKAAKEASKLASWKENVQKNQQTYLHCDKPIRFRERLPPICKFLKQQCKQCCSDANTNNAEDAGARSYKNSAEMNALKKLVGTLMFGQPKNQVLVENNFTGFSNDQINTINSVFMELTKERGPEENGVEITIVWISLMNSGKIEEPTEVPVFRITAHGPNEETVYNFVDLIGRRYKNWGDFVSNNKLPSSICCFPKEGVYSEDEKGEVQLEFGCTPAASLGRKILNGTDIAGGVISVGAGIGFFFPPAFIACCVASGVVSAYGIVRASVKLADRGNHNQSIADKEAFREWFSLTGCVLGLGASGAMVACMLLAQEGKLVSEIAITVVNRLKWLAGGVNGLGLADQTLHVLRHNGKLDLLQCFQMACAAMLLIACAGVEDTMNTVVTLAEKVVLPLIVRKIKSIFQKIESYVSLNDLLNALEKICKQFPYGREFMRAVRIIIDLYNCKSIKDASNIMGEFMNLLNRLYIVRRTLHTSSKAETEKEIMSNIVNDDNFVPQLLYLLESEEQNFHFPADHCHWGDNGELSPEEYTKIGQNFLEIPGSIQSHVWMDNSACTAHVHFEQFGLVTIKSCVPQQIMTLKHIKKATQTVQNA